MMERELHQVRPGIWRIVAPNPSPMTGPGTNTYLIGQRRALIIDPGPALDSHQQAIEDALRQLGLTSHLIVVSHRHADHSAGAVSLARRLNAPLAAYQRGLGAGADYQHPLQPGQALPVDGFSLSVQHTPGHCDDHLCLWIEEARILLTADLVAGAGTILITPPDGDMAAYLESLRAMLALDPALILPGHGPVIDTPRQKLQEYIDHRLRREQQVLEAIQRGLRSAKEIARYIYADQPAALSLASLQVQAHLTKLEREGKLD
ncbi:MAG: MBL fold metallo-hydrolase [Anaerolineae bacterium]